MGSECAIKISIFNSLYAVSVGCVHVSTVAISVRRDGSTEAAAAGECEPSAVGLELSSGLWKRRTLSYRRSPRPKHLNLLGENFRVTIKYFIQKYCKNHGLLLYI